MQLDMVIFYSWMLKKRAYNHFGWPYIGIVAKDGNNNISICCEAIVSSEELNSS